MSDFDDEDFSLGAEDSEDEQLAESEDFEDDPASDESDEEVASKPKKVRVSPKKSTKKSLHDNNTTKSPATSKPVSGVRKSPASSTTKSTNSKVMKAEDAEEAVLDYMFKVRMHLSNANRPYSLLNVFENMHRAIAKPSLSKLLDNLVVKEKLVSKTYGKAKIYYVNQNLLPVPSEEDRHNVEEQIKLISTECSALEQELKIAEATLSTITSQISNKDLDATLMQLEETVVTLEKKVESMGQPDRVAVSPNRKDSLKRKFTKYHTAWVKRKRIAMDGINQIADGMEKKAKHVLDLVGIETDEEVGIKVLPTL
ncbi:putative pairing protein [Plasmopara halstedii]